MHTPAGVVGFACPRFSNWTLGPHPVRTVPERPSKPSQNSEVVVTHTAGSRLRPSHL